MSVKENVIRNGELNNPSQYRWISQDVDKLNGLLSLSILINSRPPSSFLFICSCPFPLSLPSLFLSVSPINFLPVYNYFLLPSPFILGCLFLFIPIFHLFLFLFFCAINFYHTFSLHSCLSTVINSFLPFFHHSCFSFPVYSHFPSLFIPSVYTINFHLPYSLILVCLLLSIPIFPSSFLLCLFLFTHIFPSLLIPACLSYQFPSILALFLFVYSY